MRDIKKAIDQYEAMTDNKTNKAAFFLSDYRQIMDLSREQDGSQLPDPYTLINNALKAGFAIGYRSAKRK